MDYKSLCNNRTAAKGQVTRVQDWINKKSQGINSISIFEAKLDIVEKYFDKYSIAQNSIEILVEENDNLTDSEEREVTEEMFVISIAALKDSIKKLSPSSSSTPIRNNSSVPVSQDLHSNVKLPDIKLGSFDGSRPSEWGGFIDIFEALIGIALKTLRDRYENKSIVVNEYLSNIVHFPQINKCNSEVLREFASSLRKDIECLNNLNLTDKVLTEALLVFLFEQKLDANSRKSFEEERKTAQIPTLKEFFDFIDKRCVILENLSSFENANEKKHNVEENKTVAFKPKVNLHASCESNARPPSPRNRPHSRPSSPNFNATCVICNGAHRIYSCARFTALPPRERFNSVKQKKLCFNCLGYQHSIKDCRSTISCSICRQKHHTLIHLDSQANSNTQYAPRSQTYHTNNNHTHPQHSNIRQNNSYHDNSRNHTPDSRTRRYSQQDAHSRQSTTPDAQERPNQAPQAGNHVNRGNYRSQTDVSYASSHNAVTQNRNQESQVLLATAEVVVFSHNGQPMTVKMLLDNGSQNSFVTTKLAEQLGLPSETQNLHVSGLSGQETLISREKVKLEINSKVNKRNFVIDCSVIDTISQRLPQYSINPAKLNIPAHLISCLADSTFAVPSEIQILGGAEIYYSLLSHGLLHLGKGLPSLINTHLGWVISGNVPQHCLENTPKEKVYAFTGISDALSLEHNEENL
ncbi:uncharacterized protein LOC126892833 [Diabrotica virgifera virgifera]|uniref:Peptidase aspartic putative domain-containing protein n=1 Tax=Diabrotica virgifera virgifera TaxID=50390 RepID=A0ABM5L7W0_DIAVI|nr:uncharacterized protein LOC126892832 [Diabrotica virgifera virgifera]XP_050518527.1 uncharacterized protein LOC126892833 [Diabrotica virgifera virgifera]